MAYSRPFTRETLREGFRALVIGPPGSGKGYISQQIVKKYGCVYISTGDILRQNIRDRTELGKIAAEHIRAGGLVPDSLITKLMHREVLRKHNEKFLLDGYPRTLKQAMNLTKTVDVDFVIHLSLPPAAILRRIRGRLVHLASGRTYNREHNPPKIAGLDDVTGETLTMRDDDNSEIWFRRMKNYFSTMNPVIGYFDKLNMLQTFHVRQHENLWPSIERYLNVRWMTIQKQRRQY